MTYLGTAQTLSSHDVAAKVGITYRQLDYWVRLGIIDGQGAVGSGTPRVWTPEQVKRVREIKAALEKSIGILEKAGMPSHASFLRGNPS